jgi:hypothetical protein
MGGRQGVGGEGGWSPTGGQVCHKSVLLEVATIWWEASQELQGRNGCRGSDCTRIWGSMDASSGPRWGPNRGCQRGKVEG